MSILAFPSIVNIVDVSGMARSGLIFVVAAPKRTNDVVIEKSSSEKIPVVQVANPVW